MTTERDPEPADPSPAVPEPSAGPLRVAVLGPGGVGGLIAALLVRAGDQVTCLAGPATARGLRMSGLRITSARFGELAVPVAAAELLEEPVDACLVTVKAGQLDEALTRVPPEVLGRGLLVPLLNGIEHVVGLRHRYPAATVVAASISVESTRTALGEIRHDSPFAAVQLADPGHDPAVRRLASHLERSGLDVRVRSEEAQVLWEKLAFLGPLALLTTHSQATVGDVRARRHQDLRLTIEEVVNVARSQGATLDADRIGARVDGVPASMRTSMQRDAAAGRALELEAIGGAVLRAAGRAGVPVPVTASLVDDLRAGRFAPITG